METARRLKTIAAALAVGVAMCAVLCGAAGLFAAVVGWRQTTPAAAIDRVLRADSERNDGGGPADVVTRMRAIDLQDCPEDFRDAYVEHILAWQASADAKAAEEALDAASDPTVADSGERPLDDAPIPEEDAAAEQAVRVRIAGERRSAQQRIESTFEVVKRVAAKHGSRFVP